MDFGLKDKVAVVSGGSRGCGRAVAEVLAAEGAHVTVAARGKEALDETVETITARGGSVVGVIADMTDASDIARVVEVARSKFGPPQIAVSNVYPPDAPYRMGFEDADDEAFDAGHKSLIMGIAHLVREVLPDMKERRWGRLVNIGSGVVKTPHAPPAVMVLSNIGRLGAVGLMKSLAFEYGQYNITSNTVATGAMATERAVAYYQGRNSSTEAQSREWAAEEFPLGVPRFGDPAELAALVAFLCSEQASYISGETIGVNGARNRATW